MRSQSGSRPLQKLQGYQYDTATAGGKVPVTEMKQYELVRNKFHYELVRSIFAEMEPRGTVRSGFVMAAARDGQEVSKLEKELGSLVGDDLGAWVEEKLRGYKLPELCLTIKAHETVPYQVPRTARYQTPGKLRDPVMAALRMKVKKRHLRVVTYQREQWISPMFVKAKGRDDPETGMEAVRFLTDLRALNSALETSGQRTGCRTLPR